MGTDDGALGRWRGNGNASVAATEASELFTAQATDDVIAERSAEAKEALQGTGEGGAWREAI